MSSLLRWLFGITEGDLAGADGWTLRLIGVPENIWVLLGLVAAFAAVVVLTIRSYRREGDNPPRAKALPATLRLITLVTLFLIILQPAIVFLHRKALYSTVVVLVDDSLSMRWADRFEDDAERTALAKNLGVGNEQLSGAERLTRAEIVRRTLAQKGGPIALLAKDHPLLLVRFSTDDPGRAAYTQVLASTDPVAPKNGTDAATAAPEVPAPLAAALAHLQASGYETNLGRAIREAARKVEGRRVAAMVVLSDGQNTAAEGPGAPGVTAAIDFVRQRGIPLYSVVVGRAEPPKNLLVAQLQGPGEVRKGSDLVLTALVTHRHLAGETVTVELMRAKVDGSETPDHETAWERLGVAEQVVLAGGEKADDGAGDMQAVALHTTADEVGRYIYKAVVAPREDELVKTDNEATTTVKVSDAKVAVLFVGGDGGWEFQYLRNYLLRHPEHYLASLWQQNTEPEFSQEASSPEMRLRTLPRSREDLFRYDVVILYDPRHTGGGFDGEFASLLDEFVARHHGGVCWIAGNKHADEYLAGTDATFKPLRDLLPVSLERNATPFADRLGGAGRTAWPLRLTAFGTEHPLMQLESSPEENERVWQILPGLFWSHPVAHLKTLASALALSGDPGRQTLDGQREPVLAVQYYGKGRVLYVGFDSTWRWRYVQGATYYEKFWSNTVDFLAAGRLEKKRLIITTGGETFDTGAEIRVRVEAYDREFEPLKADSLTVRMTNLATGESTEHVLKAAKRGPGDAGDAGAVREGLFEGVIPATQTGTFEIRPAAGEGTAANWTDEDVAPRRIEVRLPQEEFRRPEADWTAMRQLADEDARFLTIADVGKLPALIPPGKAMSTSEVPRPIWNTLPALLLIGLLLLAEWAVRKAYNMA